MSKEKMPDHVARELFRFFLKTAIPRRLAAERNQNKRMTTLYDKTREA